MQEIELLVSTENGSIVTNIEVIKKHIAAGLEEYKHMGELYLAENGSSWAKKYETKYPAGRPLHYGYPGTGDHCFETAKETHKEEWTNIVRREVGKG